MPQLMTVEELGEYLRFTRKTIYKMLKEGSLPAIRIGNKWRFDKTAIDDWLLQSTESSKISVLVVDDDEIIRLLFQDTLEEEGHSVVAAGNSTECIECVKRQDFDLVFLDLKMPDMDGAELLKQLRSLKPRLPVTVITGYPGSQLMAKALQQGPLGVMEKPFNAPDIITAVNSFRRANQ